MEIFLLSQYFTMGKKSRAVNLLIVVSIQRHSLEFCSRNFFSLLLGLSLCRLPVAKGISQFWLICLIPQDLSTLFCHILVINYLARLTLPGQFDTNIHYYF